MKLATIRSVASERIGVVHGSDRFIFDLAAAASRAGAVVPAFSGMLSLIDEGDRGLDQAREFFERYGREGDLSIPVAEADILAPVPEPRQMRDGMSFPLHILQGPRGPLKSKARAKGTSDRLGAQLRRME